MAFDNHADFGKSLIATAPSPATSGTSLSVTAGEGALFPSIGASGGFNCTVWDGEHVETSEIVRVTSKGTGDNWTIQRTQESTSARTILVGDVISNTVTKKTITDIESAVTTLQTAQPTSGSHAIASGVDHESITGLALSFTPSRVGSLSISRPSGGLNLRACDVSGTLTADGFDFELDGVTDATTYVLNYVLYP